MEKYLTIIIQEDGSVEFPEEISEQEKLQIAARWWKKELSSEGFVTFNTGIKHSQSKVDTLPMMEKLFSYVVVHSPASGSYSYICTRQGEEQRSCDQQQLRLLKCYILEEEAQKLTLSLNEGSIAIFKPPSTPPTK